MLPSWVVGDNTVQTLFKNTVDFYFSFSIGIALAIALAGIFQAVSGFRKRKAELAARGDQQSQTPRLTPANRGDIPTWFVIFVYFLMTLSYILLSGFLIHWQLNSWSILTTSSCKNNFHIRSIPPAGFKQNQSPATIYIQIHKRI